MDISGRSLLIRRHSATPSLRLYATPHSGSMSSFVTSRTHFRIYAQGRVEGGHEGVHSSTRMHAVVYQTRSAAIAAAVAAGEEGGGGGGRSFHIQHGAFPPNAQPWFPQEEACPHIWRLRRNYFGGSLQRGDATLQCLSVLHIRYNKLAW